MPNMDLPTTAGAELTSVDDHQQMENDLFAAPQSAFLDHAPTTNFMASQEPFTDPWTYNDSSFGAAGYGEAHLYRSLTGFGTAQNLPGANFNYEPDNSMNNYFSSESLGFTASHAANPTTASLPRDMMSPDLFKDEYAFNNMASQFEHFDNREHEANNNQTAIASTTKQLQSRAKASSGLETPSPTKTPSSAKSTDDEFLDNIGMIVDPVSGKRHIDTLRKLSEDVPAARKEINALLKKRRKSKVEQVPYLKPVPKQKDQADRQCPTCPGKVKINGNNDGEHCTRCFNKLNNDIKLENGMRLTLAEQDIVVEPRSDASKKYPKKNKQSYTVATSVHDGANTRIGAPNTASASGMPSYTSNDYFGNSHAVAGDNLNALYHKSGLPSTSQIEVHYNAQAAAGTEMNRLLLPTSVRFKTEQDARNYLANLPREACQPIDFENDDWQQVKGELLDGFIIELIRVLPIPGSTPAGMDQEQRTTYEGKHAKRLGMVQAYLRDPVELVKVEARARLVMDEVVRIHQFGIPQSAYARLSQGSNRGSGYKPELDFICSARARRVIELASQSKYIALDVCEGNNLEEMALAPEKYFAKKVSNSNSNGRREGKDDAPKKGKGKKVKKVDDSVEIDPVITNDASNFDKTYAPPNGYQSYAVPSWGMYVDKPPQASNIFDLVPATAGAGSKRRYPYGLDDETDMLGNKRSKFGNEDGYGEDFDFN